MSSQHQSLVTFAVAGKPYGEFATRTGGETSGASSKYRPAGGAKQKSRRGLSETSDVTISREWERERDIGVVAALRPLAGNAACVVTDQPLDDDGVAFGRPEVFTGTLMTVNSGDSDANSDDGRTLELTIMVLEVS